MEIVDLVPGILSNFYYLENDMFFISTLWLALVIGLALFVIKEL